MDIKVANKKGGVVATLTGFDVKKVEEKINSCKNGACESAQNPDFKEKIKSVEFSEKGGIGTIEIMGDVDASMIKPMMESCLKEGENSCCSSNKKK